MGTSEDSEGLKIFDQSFISAGGAEKFPNLERIGVVRGHYRSEGFVEDAGRRKQIDLEFIKSARTEGCTHLFEPHYSSLEHWKGGPIDVWGIGEGYGPKRRS